VAKRAVLREPGRRVVRIVRALIIFQVAGITSRGEALINAASVALHAGNRDVRTGQRERGLRCVIERRTSPIRGRVTQRAILRESRGRMIRIVGALVIFQMAGIACRAQPFVNAAGMALCAGGRDVFAGQREGSLGRVIEDRAGPIRGGVAKRTILRKPRRGMRRIIGALVILHMA
jgi:hypothetical protein